MPMPCLTRMPYLHWPAILWLSLLAMTGQVQAQGPEYWLVSTRECPQILGADPLPFLQAFRVDSQGGLSRRDPAELVTTHRPVIFLVHGSYYTAEMSAREGRRIG